MVSTKHQIEAATQFLKLGSLDAALAELKLIEEEDQHSCEVLLLYCDINGMKRKREADEATGSPSTNPHTGH